MKRAAICVPDPENYIPQFNDHSLVIINPDSSPQRLAYLLDKADWSVLITKDQIQYRDGADYANERALWYTSGTTGDSKFYSFTQKQIDYSAHTICQAYNLTANDRYLSVMPLWHSHGQGFYWATQLAGCETHFQKITDLRSGPKIDPTFISAIPDFLKILIRQNFNNLRFVRSASSSLPLQLYQALADTFRVPVIEAFGMTESLSHCFTNPLHGEQRANTVGLPSGVEARITNGQLYIRGPSVFTSQWFATGDLAEQDSAGYYCILGRQQDRINIKGYKLDPLSIENQLRQMLPELEELVVFGEDRVKCIYRGPYSTDQVKQCLKSLGSYCVPALLQHVDDIPKNNSGKISRKQLNELF